MLYQLRVHSTAKKQLQALDRVLRKEFIAEIKGLQEDPYPPHTLAMRDEWVGYYRIRIDGWRLIYSVDEKEKTLSIERIARRHRNTYL